MIPQANHHGVLTLKARAKINLALGVSSPLPPNHPKAGFHEIASWMAAIDLCDDLHVSRSLDGPGHLHISWAVDAPRPTPIDWAIESDLVYRAWKLLEAASGRSLPVIMELHKRVPVGGGLGGGSADAAAALLAINALFDLRFSPEALRHLGAQLGSDIAFFLDNGPPASPPRPALVTGLGEQLERAPQIESDLLLIIPPFGCPTRPVYQAFDTLLHNAAQDARAQHIRALMFETNPLCERALFNDLAAAAAAVALELQPLRQRIASALNRPVHVTGSGSCMFVLPQGTLGDSLRSSWVRSVADAGACAIWTRFAVHEV